MFHFLNYFLAALSGLLLALAFPYPSITILAWVGVIPLFFAIKRSDFRNAPVLGLIAGAVFFATVLYWILIFGYLAWIALSLFLSLSFILFASAAWIVMRNYKGASQFIIIPSLWAVAEHVRSLGPWGFTWGNLGSTVDHPFLLMIASYIGESGLGFIIILTSLILFRLLEGFRIFKGEGFTKQIRVVAMGILVLVPAITVWPVIEMMTSGPPGEPPGTIKVSVIQPNIAQSLKADMSNNDDIKARLVSMTEEVLSSEPELIIWPESSLISYVSDEKRFIEGLGSLLAPTETSLIFGGLDYDSEGNILNNAFYLNRENVLQSYSKIRLVPFGEYVPARSLVERLNNMAGLVNDYTPGRDYKVFGIGRQEKFSTIICFESSDSALVGKMIRSGARLLVVVTNDGWFGETAAAEQHFRITRMRAAEHRVPVIQAANTGISGIINRDGAIVARSALNEERTLGGTVTFPPEPSFFSKFGRMIPYLYLTVALIAILYRARNFTVLK